MILLINPKLRNKLHSFSIPMGLMHIGSYLYSKGYDVQIFDRNNDRSNDVIIDWNKVSLVGLSVMTGQIKDAIKIAKFIRNIDKNIPIVWGGVHPTLYNLENESLVDISVSGRGEEKMLLMTADIETRSRNEQPFRIHWNLLEGFKEAGAKASIYENGLPILTSRGCPYKCSFCINTRSQYTFDDAETVLKNIEEAIALGWKKIYFLDENFVANKKRLKDICDLIVSKGFKFEWFCSSRVDSITEEVLENLKAAGCIKVGLGAESGSNEVLKILNKEIIRDQIIDAAILLNKYGINADFSFMIGIPREIVDDMEQTIDLIWKIKKINPKFGIAGPQIYRPYPGSELYSKLEIKEPKNLEEWANFDYPQIIDIPKHLLNSVNNLSFYCNMINRFPIMSSIAKLRYKYSFVNLPVEKVAYDIVSKIR